MRQTAQQQIPTPGPDRPITLQLFLDAYNHARRLKTLRGLTPYEHICKTWIEQPHRFITDPTHHTQGPNI